MRSWKKEMKQKTTKGWKVCKGWNCQGARSVALRTWILCFGQWVASRWRNQARLLSASTSAGRTRRRNSGENGLVTTINPQPTYTLRIARFLEGSSPSNPQLGRVVLLVGVIRSKEESRRAKDRGAKSQREVSGACGKRRCWVRWLEWCSSHMRGHSWSKSTSGTRSCAVLQWWLCWCHWDNEGCNQSLGCLDQHEFYYQCHLSVSGFWIQTGQDQKEVLKIIFDLMMESRGITSFCVKYGCFQAQKKQTPKENSRDSQIHTMSCTWSTRSVGKKRRPSQVTAMPWWPWNTMGPSQICGIRLMSVVFHCG